MTRSDRFYFEMVWEPRLAAWTSIFKLLLMLATIGTYVAVLVVHPCLLTVVLLLASPLFAMIISWVISLIIKLVLAVLLFVFDRETTKPATYSAIFAFSFFVVPPVVAALTFYTIIKNALA